MIKNIKLTIHSVLLFSVVVFLFSACKKNNIQKIIIPTQQESISQSNPNSSIIHKLKGTSDQISQSIITKVNASFFSNKSSRKFDRKEDVKSNYSINNAIIADYENTSLRAIIIPENGFTEQSDNCTAFIIPVSGDSLTGLSFFIKKETIGENKYKFSYLTSDNILVGEMTVDKGIIIDMKGYNGNIKGNTNSRTTGFWSNWGKCIAAGFSSFVDGNPVHAAVGLVCVAAGPACATGAALGCAAASL